jgi:hypothetical protein
LAVFKIDETRKNLERLKRLASQYNLWFTDTVSPTMKFTAATFVAVIGTAAAFSGSSS